MTWFVMSGLLRLCIAVVAVIGGVLLTGVLDLDLIGFAAFGAVGVYALSAFGIAPVLETAAADKRLRVFVGRGRGAARAFTVLAYGGLFGFVLGFVVFGLFAHGAYLWIGERGGAGALYLTCSVALLAALAVSAAARLLCAPLALWPKALAALPNSRPSRVWETCEAAALLCSLLLCVYGIALGALGAEKSFTRVDEGGNPIRPGAPVRSLAHATDRELLIGLAPIQENLMNGWIAGLLWVFTLGIGYAVYAQSHLNRVWRALPEAESPSPAPELIGAAGA